MSVPHYALDELGWLQFQALCDLVLELEGGADPSGWHGEADRMRLLDLADGLTLPSLRLTLRGPVRVHAVWAARGSALWRAAREGREQRLGEAPWPSPAERGFQGARVVLTNVEATDAVNHTAVMRVAGVQPGPGTAVLGRDELAAIVEAHAELRLRMPSLLGVRPFEGLVAPEVAARSTVDVSAAHALARVYVPTSAHARALAVLGRHCFTVLTGPPEMGKTATAGMIALGRLSAGWEAHDCRTPDDLLRALEADRAQVFVADDAFGSTEYRPDAAERWARELPRVLRVLDDRHWLIWTSRSAPLRAGLHRVHQERGAARFLVAHPHFTPERIRRFAATRLADLGTPVRASASCCASPTLPAPRSAYRIIEGKRPWSGATVRGWPPRGVSYAGVCWLVGLLAPKVSTVANCAA